MALENKLGISNQIELARQEEKISKQKAKQLFQSGQLDNIEAGTFKGLSEIHRTLFGEIYDFAGKMREVNISKNDFLFAPTMYLSQSVQYIDGLPYDTFHEIITKYVEMNIAHPFREGNGRAMRIWLDLMLKKALGQVVDWNLIDKDAYLSAMRRSPINALEIQTLIGNALTNDCGMQTFMKGIDVSYYYEGYYEYRTEDL